MDRVALILLGLAVAVLAINQVVQGKRLGRLRRRTRRSMLIGPESHLRMQKQLYDSLAREDCRVRGFVPRLPIEFRSEWGEDTLLYDLFRDRPEGVYIEVGALDGRRNSVTWVFEAIGWRGLLVEAIPERCEECRANRPGSKVVHAALGPPGGSGTAVFVVPVEEEHQLSGYREHEGMQKEHLLALERASAATRRVEVPLITMDRALEGAGFDRVDFASIDVEGGELDVLRGFDLERFKPAVLVIEDLTLGEDDSVAKVVRSRGYEQAMWIGANRVFIRRDDRGLAERARRLSETVYSPFVRPRGQPDAAPIELR
jgi:FkbM family methyltransferase